MNTDPDTKNLLSLALPYLQQKLPNLLAIYLFGSRAQGLATENSDIDLSVLVDAKVNAIQLWELSQELANRCAHEVDLVNLQKASTVMQYQIIMHGQRLWAKDIQADLYECFILSEKTELDTDRAELLMSIQHEGRIYGQ